MSNVAYQKITDLIVEALKKGVVPWQRPWNMVNGGIQQCNYTNKNRPYRGINAMIKATTAMLDGRTSPYWVTQRQAELLGGTVKGIGSPTFYWKFFDVEVDGSKQETAQDKLEDLDVDVNEAGDPEQEPETERRAFMRFSVTYSIEQVVGSKALDKVLEEDRKAVAATNPDFVDIEACEELVARNQVCEVREGGNKAFYRKGSDRIHMPAKTQYENPANYYHVLFHELAHATGHPDRLNREKATVWGNRNYAFEELVAEITACYLSNDCGIIDKINFENSQSYIQGWLEALEDNPKFVVMAAAKAQHAAHWIKHGCKADVKMLVDNPEQSLHQRIETEMERNVQRPRIPGVGAFHTMSPTMRVYHASKPPIDALLRALDFPSEAKVVTDLCGAILDGDLLRQNELIESVDFSKALEVLRENRFSQEADILTTLNLNQSVGVAAENPADYSKGQNSAVTAPKPAQKPARRRVI